MKYLIYLYIIWNIFVFLLYGIDKGKSKRDAWRIPEKTLLGAAFLLGGVGAFLGMQVFRHKTKHMQFVIGVPLAIIFNFICIYYVATHLLK